MPNCPHCKQEINDWYWIRFEGVGAWKDNERQKYYACPKCNKRFDGSEIPEIKEVEGQKGPSVRIQEPNGMRSY